MKTSEKIRNVLNSLPSKAAKKAKREISKIGKESLSIEIGSLLAYGVIRLEEKVPNLLPLGYITATLGVEVGKGEILAALAFEDGIMNDESNGPYDIKIGENFWHVKAYNPNHGLRFSNKDEFSIRNTGIFQQLPSNLRSKALEINNTDLVKEMQKWGKGIKGKLLEDDEGNPLDSDYEVFEAWSRQSVKAAIGDAQGVIWFYNDTFVVSHPRDLILFGTTQDGRIVLKCNKLFAKNMTVKEKYSFSDMKERVL